MNKEEKIGIIRQAQERLQETIMLLENVFNDDYVHDFLISHLKIIVSNDHDYTSSDLNLDDLVTQINEE